MIQIRNLSKSYGDHKVLDGIDLSVGAGRVVVIIGPSGGGKSTLLRCINYLEEPDSGTILLDNEPVFFDLLDGHVRRHSERKIAAVRARIGMVFQDFNLFGHMTAVENVLEGPVQVLGMSREAALARAHELLASVGLADRTDYYPHELSGGQKQRVAIARALAMKPAALLFDEPTSALDPELVGEVLSVMKNLCRQGMTMIIVTHEMSFAREVADEIVFMDGGRIIERAPPRTLFSAPQSDRTRQFLQRLSA